MATGVPGLAPEHLWPSGDMPPELRLVMANEAAAMNATATHEVVPSGIALPPREFDPTEIEAERPPMTEGDALLTNLRAAVGKPPNGTARTAPRPMVPFAAPPALPDLHYAFPLSEEVRAEVNVHGKATAADLWLLVDYIRLTARKMQTNGPLRQTTNGKTANASLSEHHSGGPDEKLPEKRRRPRTRER